MKALDIIGDSKIPEAKREADTIRLWETYRDQALLWRSIALLQIPATFIALLFAYFVWQNRSQVIHVPQKPLPGFHQIGEIPEDEFINSATEFVNLIATYTSANAREQFRMAMNHLREPALQTFRKEYMEDELRFIETSQRTQVYFADPSKTLVRKTGPREISVLLMGERSKFIAGRELPSSNTVYKVTLTTVPRNKLNPYGIMVTGLSIEDDVRSLNDYHRKFIKEEKKEAKRASRSR